MPKEECLAIAKGLLGGNPCDFLWENVVAVCDLIDDESRTTTGLAENMVPTVAIRKYDALEDKEAEGARVYSLREDMNGYLEAHYLPWNRNTGYYIILDVNDPPPLFFTAMLSGCGVGFVEAPDQSAVRFSHHNISRPKTIGVPDYGALDRSLAFTEASLHPRQYRGEDGTGFAHVHGVMQDNHCSSTYKSSS